MKTRKGIRNPLIRAAVLGVADPAAEYAAAVLATSPLAYWKLNEGTGTTLTDSSGNGYGGTYSGVAWTGTSPFDEAAPSWDGANDYGNVYSAGFGTAFNMDEGCIILWLKTNSAAVWTDGTLRRVCMFQRDATNNILIRKDTANNSLTFLRNGNSTTQSVQTTQSPAVWTSVALSWSVLNNQLKAYVNGVQVGTTQTGLIASAGSGLSSTQAVLGATTNSGLQAWHGNLAQVAIYNTPIDDARIALMAG